MPAVPQGGVVPRVVVGVAQHDVHRDPPEQLVPDRLWIDGVGAEDIEHLRIGCIPTDHLVEGEHGQSGHGHHPRPSRPTVEPSNEKDITVGGGRESPIDGHNPRRTGEVQPEGLVPHPGVLRHW